MLVPHVMLLASYGAVSGALADPPGSSVVVAALAWLEQTLLGTIAAIVAVLAVASVGLMMLAGRINLRYGLTVIAGCFILFGASTIVAGIQASLAGDRGPSPNAQETPPPMVAAPISPPLPATGNTSAPCTATSVERVSPGDCGLRLEPLRR